MTYAVKELFYSLQGEGANTGRAAVFCRFAGCNLWSGREVDRADAECNFCDTDFVGTDGDGGGTFADADALADAIESMWPEGGAEGAGQRLVILTGGEPGLQVDDALVKALSLHRFQIAIETNGTRALPEGIHWVTVSPKGQSSLNITEGNELKLVFPQRGLSPEQFAELPFDHFFLQPMAGPDETQSTELALEYCRRHPKWRLSLQTHKLLGIR